MMHLALLIEGGYRLGSCLFSPAGVHGLIGYRTIHRPKGIFYHLAAIVNFPNDAVCLGFGVGPDGPPCPGIG